MIDSTKGIMKRIESPAYSREVIFDNYKERDWNYQNIKDNKNIFLNGKSKKKIIFSPKKEEKIYNNIKVYPQPNTKRTILPEYAPIIKEKLSKKKVDIKSFSQGKQKIHRGKKIIINNNRESDEEIPHNNKKPIKDSMFQKYKITQITTLPGAIIRDVNNIDDDENNINKIKEKKNNTINFLNKIKYDYSSSITCLPNSLTNKKEKTKIKRGKSYNYFKYTNDNNILYNNFHKNKIKRDKISEDKVRNFINNNVNNDFNKENIIIQRYKNAESYQCFDMLKPSSIFEKKYAKIL